MNNQFFVQTMATDVISTNSFRMVYIWFYWTKLAECYIYCSSQWSNHLIVAGFFSLSLLLSLLLLHRMFVSKNINLLEQLVNNGPIAILFDEFVCVCVHVCVYIEDFVLIVVGECALVTLRWKMEKGFLEAVQIGIVQSPPNSLIVNEFRANSVHQQRPYLSVHSFHRVYMASLCLYLPLSLCMFAFVFCLLFWRITICLEFIAKFDYHWFRRRVTFGIF